ncbi:hypothetical protein HDU79_005356 [Rhizoclosmatium sp. JEL0117]|nr:hypothetical protein HDU79_005356 [Rhizoclosmatium sp. JEL0117]
MVSTSDTDQSLQTSTNNAKDSINKRKREDSPVDSSTVTAVESKEEAKKLKEEEPAPLKKRNFDVEIEEAHTAACAAKQQMYDDPATGYSVMTAWYLKEKQECCGNACRHCPYGHSRVKDSTRRKNKIKSPVFLKPSATKKGTLDSIRNSTTITTLPDSRFSSKQEFESADGLIVLFWSGGKDSFLTLSTLLQNAGPKASIVLLTTFDAETSKVPIQNISIGDISAQASCLNLPLLLVPRGADSKNETYIKTITDALEQLSREMSALDSSKSSTIQYLVFGDLFLEDIRAWRESSFSNLYPCRFPLFELDFQKNLLPRLWELCEEYEIRISFSAMENEVMKKWVNDEGLEKDDEGNVRYTKSLVERSDFPETVDLMGERGEFHTKVSFLDMWDKDVE